MDHQPARKQFFLPGKRFWKYSLSSFLIILTFMFCSGQQDSAKETPLTDRFDPETQSYAFVVPTLKPLAGVGGIKAADCGVCHKQIFREWQQTTHANSLNDIQFQSELTKPDSPKWLCLNCHIPVQNQREYIITHLIDNDIFQPVTRRNPDFDYQLQQEGVTCATCHIRADQETGESYVIGPNGNQNAPHPVRKNQEFLHNMCQRCHNPQGEGLTPNLICWFYTTDELAGSQTLIEETFGEQKNCVSCHMPKEKRHVAEDFKIYPEQEVNQHHWVGSGIPKWFSGYDSLLNRGYKGGLEVTVGTPQQAADGDSVTVDVHLTNARAGHHLPTGDPERFILAVASISDAGGNVQYEKKLRIGQHWLWNPARKIGDNRITFGETRLWKATLPSNSARKGQLTVTVLHVRLNTNTAKYIIAAENVDESLFPNGQDYVRNAIHHNPFASFVYNLEIDLNSGERRVYSPEELVALSKAEKGKALSERLY